MQIMEFHNNPSVMHAVGPPSNVSMHNIDLINEQSMPYVE